MFYIQNIGVLLQKHLYFSQKAPLFFGKKDAEHFEKSWGIF